MNIQLAVREYARNQLDVVIRETGKPLWTHTTLEDLRKEDPLVRLGRKDALVKRFPGLLSGPHGASLRDNAWLPITVIRMTFSRSELETPYDTDLEICTVYWRHPMQLIALSFYNNHIDKSAIIEHFVVDGASTPLFSSAQSSSRTGASFIAASQRIFQDIEASTKNAGPVIKSLKTGVSFRVGHTIGELHWRQNEGMEPQVQVRVSDLTPVSLTALRASPNGNEGTQSLSADWDTFGEIIAHMLSSKAKRTREKTIIDLYELRAKLSMSTKLVGKCTEPSHESSFITSDEVVVTVVGLPSTLTPESVFSGVFGFILPLRVWRISAGGRHCPTIQFYKPALSPPVMGSAAEKPAFYHRYLLVPDGIILNRLGLNYIGDLLITDDKRAVVTSGPLFAEFKHYLSAAMDRTIRSKSDLASEIALDILTDNGLAETSLSRILSPLDENDSDAYRTVFCKAFLVLDKISSPDTPIYPFATEGEDLIKELGMTAIQVSTHIRAILKKSGAFPDIQTYATSLLLQAPVCGDDIPYSDCLRRALADLTQTAGVLSIRQYCFSYPTIVWDKESGTFVSGIPAHCDVHPDTSCACWVGPYLHDAISSWESGASRKPISKAALFRVYSQYVQHIKMGNIATEQTTSRRLSTDCTSGPRLATEDNGSDSLEYIDPDTAPLLDEFVAFRPPPLSTSNSTTVVADGSHLSPTFLSNLGHQGGNPKSPPIIADENDTFVGMDALLQDVRSRVLSYVRANTAKERQDTHRRVEELRAEITDLQLLATQHRSERENQLQVLETKERAIMERDLLLDQRHAALQEKDGRLAQLKQSLRALSRRNQKLEADVKHLEERDRERTRKLQEELAGLQQRLSFVFDKREDMEDGEAEEQDEPPRKRQRA